MLLRSTTMKEMPLCLNPTGAEVSFADPHVESFGVRGRDVPRIEDL